MAKIFVFLNFILFIYYLYSRFLLVIYFIHISVCMSIPISQFIPTPPSIFPPWCPNVCSLHLCLHFCLANQFICTIFQDLNDAARPGSIWLLCLHKLFPTLFPITPLQPHPLPCWSKTPGSRTLPPHFLFTCFLCLQYLFPHSHMTFSFSSDFSYAF